MIWHSFRGLIPILALLLLAGTAAYAADDMICPLGGEQYAEDKEHCPEHGVQLVGSDKLYRDPLSGMAFIRVEGGCFQKQGGDGDASPAKEVCVDTFWMGVFEVTQAQWSEVLLENLAKFQDCGPDCPAENLSWIDANELISHMRRRGGATCRLPTEEEWEYAARGGRRSQNYRYAGSNEVDAVAWYQGNSGNTTHRVGLKRPNELGLYDMSGNVWEWVESRPEADAPAESSQAGQQKAWSGSPRVIRGGSWISSSAMLEPAYRHILTTSDRNSSLGLRLVASP